MDYLDSFVNNIREIDLSSLSVPYLDDILSRNADPIKDQEPELEIEPSEIIEILPKCCEFDRQINLLSEAYHLVYGGPKNLLNNSSNLLEIKTPMKNTILHIASWYGNDDIVTLVIEQAPKLLFTFNKNNDSVLHVAARCGHISTVKKLLANYANFERRGIAKAWLEYNKGNLDDAANYNGTSNMKDLLQFVKLKNAQGNTMLHEAMLCSCDNKKNIHGDKIFKAFEPYTIEDKDKKSLSKCCYEYALNIVNNAKQSVLYLAVENGDKDAVELILHNCHNNDAKPEGLSPIVAAIMKQNKEMLSIILEKKPTWIHSRDKNERLPLHYASSIGYLEGVDFLLGICKCCTIQRDKNGYFPIHIASYGGHVEVVNKLLEYCTDPTEMLDTSYERNILHIAANYGKHDVVQCILQSQNREHHKMINQKDNKGDTPLHLAAKSCHPKTVFYLTWDERVDLSMVNQNNETALDVINSISQLRSSSARKQLTCTALNSAGAKSNLKRLVHDKLRQNDSSKSPESKQSNDNTSSTKQVKGQNDSKPNESNENVSNTSQYFFLTGSNTQYKDRVETLTLVSTLIVTASVAACFAMPGEADGKANNLYHAMFQFFIVSITISLFSSISATIILFWAKLGLTELVTFSLKIVMPLLGIALISLSLAFMAGIYTVISKLNWLANLFLVMSVVFVVVVFLLYIILFFPSASTSKPLRLISYYPFLFLASLAE